MALGGNLPVMQRADFFDIIQTQAKTVDLVAFNTLNSVKFIKDKRKVFTRNTNAVVADCNNNLIVFAPR
mgnify:CR=1 FL=1